MNELPCFKFVCNFQSRHLCLPKFKGGENYWTNQYQIRFVLADDIQAATNYFKQHFNDQIFWPKGLHEIVSFEVVGCPGAIEWAGYNRFSVDIRTEIGKKEATIISNGIKEKFEKYLKDLI